MATDDSVRLDGVGVSRVEETLNEGTGDSPLSVGQLSLGQIDGEGTSSEDNSAVSGSSLDIEGLRVEDGAVKEDTVEDGRVDDGSGTSAGSNSSPASLPKSDGIEGISEGVGARTLSAGSTMLPARSIMLSGCSLLDCSLPRRSLLRRSLLGRSLSGRALSSCKLSARSLGKLLQSSAVTYSVDCSEGHFSAVKYSVEHTSAVS
jgi:hypothetical protein